MSNDTLEWDEDAQQRLERIPSFVRNMARARIEKAAREAGESRITAAFMDANKARLMG
jgi:hypothetical protein